MLSVTQAGNAEEWRQNELQRVFIACPTSLQLLPSLLLNQLHHRSSVSSKVVFQERFVAQGIRDAQLSLCSALSLRHSIQPYSCHVIGLGRNQYIIYTNTASILWGSC